MIFLRRENGFYFNAWVASFEKVGVVWVLWILGIRVACVGRCLAVEIAGKPEKA